MTSFNYFDAFANIMNTNILSLRTDKKISKEDYEVFCKEFSFEKLKGKSYGEAFCERFEMDDYILKNLSDKNAKYHIERLGYIK